MIFFALLLGENVGRRMARWSIIVLVFWLENNGQAANREVNFAGVYAVWMLDDTLIQNGRLRSPDT